MDGIPHLFHDVADDLPLQQPESKGPPKSSWSEQVLFHTFQLHREYPHIEWDRLHAFIQSNIATHGDTVAELALAAIREGLFDVGSGKRKHVEEVDGDGDKSARQSSVKRVKVDYGSKWRQFSGGKDYFALALNHLQTDFPYISEEYLRAVLVGRNSLYAPAHLFLFDEQRKLQDLQRQNGKVILPYIQRTVPFMANKGKGRELEDAEFARERRWLLEEFARREQDAVDVKARNEFADTSEASTAENGNNEQDCGCCFCTFPSNEMISCPGKHLFCKKCVETQTANLLVTQKSDIKCMSTDGCETYFSASELRRCLPEKLMTLWNRADTRKEVEAAGVMLEDCPFCDWACFAADVPEILYFCGNAGVCGKISCRRCKKLNHLPKTCSEAQEGKKLEGRHVIEEAMTRALVRNCPYCGKPYVKEDGCNKMTCPYCGGLSCYICRKPIEGYEHFERNDPSRPGPSRPSGKCLLMDSVEERHHVEVTEAATQALEAFKRDNPDVKQDDVKVALPPPPPPQPIVVPQVPLYMRGPPPPLRRLLDMALQPPPPRLIPQLPAQFLRIEPHPRPIQGLQLVPPMRAQPLQEQPPNQLPLPLQVQAPQYFPYVQFRMPPPHPPVQRPPPQPVQAPQYVPPRMHAPAPPPQNPLQGTGPPRPQQAPVQEHVPFRMQAPLPPQAAPLAPRPQQGPPQALPVGAVGVPYLAARPAYPAGHHQNPPHLGQRLQDQVNHEDYHIRALMQHFLNHLQAPPQHDPLIQVAPRLPPRAPAPHAALQDAQYVHAQYLPLGFLPPQYPAQYFARHGA